jgi:hypothetical protein
MYICLRNYYINIYKMPVNQFIHNFTNKKQIERIPKLQNNFNHINNNSNNKNKQIHRFKFFHHILNQIYVYKRGPLIK